MVIMFLLTLAYVACLDSDLKKTYTGLSCDRCLKAGNNHCRLKDNLGLCCPKDDIRCKKEAQKYNSEFCASDLSYNYTLSHLTCPRHNRCPPNDFNLKEPS